MYKPCVHYLDAIYHILRYFESAPRKGLIYCYRGHRSIINIMTYLIRWSDTWTPSAHACERKEEREDKRKEGGVVLELYTLKERCITFAQFYGAHLFEPTWSTSKFTSSHPIMLTLKRPISTVGLQVFGGGCGVRIKWCRMRPFKHVNSPITQYWSVTSSRKGRERLVKIWNKVTKMTRLIMKLKRIWPQIRLVKKKNSQSQP